MRTLLKAATVLFLCLLANPLFGGDCSNVSNQIGPLKNKPSELRALLDKAPQCGEVWEALGDYYYKKKLWNDAYAHYEEAIKYSPGNTKVSSRMTEIRPKLTTLIKDEEDMVKWRRRIGGTTGSLPQSFTAPQPQVTTAPAPPAAQPAEPQMQARPSTPAPKSTGTASRPSTKKSADPNIVVASKGESAPTQSTRAKMDKIALMVHFEYNSSEINAESKKLLDGFAEIINKELAGRTFVIQGHTDNIGSKEYNLWLSQERAKAVREYLAARGVDSSRLKAQGFGFDKPIYDNSTDSGRSRNRRVEFEEK